MMMSFPVKRWFKAIVILLFLAAAGGWIILNETLTSRNFVGCALMLVGMLLSQLWEIYGRYAFDLLTANKSN